MKINGVMADDGVRTKKLNANIQETHWNAHELNAFQWILWIVALSCFLPPTFPPAWGQMLILCLHTLNRTLLVSELAWDLLPDVMCWPPLPWPLPVIGSDAGPPSAKCICFSLQDAQICTIPANRKKKKKRELLTQEPCSIYEKLNTKFTYPVD